MEQDLASLTIRSHNINGFDNSSNYLYNECDNNAFSILALQEHWLRPSYRSQKGTNKLKVLHPDYDSYATSAMSKQVGDRILKGRPYGGTGFLFHRNLSKCINARVDIKCDRVTVLELCTSTNKILLINCYLPYFINANDEAQMAEYRETLGFVENIMKSHSSHEFILLMDWNCNIFNITHPYSMQINSLIKDYDLLTNYSFIDNFNPESAFTSFDTKRNSYTLIDGVLISRSLSSLVKSSSILNHHDNVSDHCPVEIVLTLQIDEFSYPKPKATEYIPWSNLSDDDINSYQHSMSHALNAIPIPVCALNHCDKICDSIGCINDIEKYYENIISAIFVADLSLPRRKHGFAKPYWSTELTELKRKSLDAHNLWKDANCPRSGPIFNEKRITNSQYKLLLRKSKNAINSDLMDNLSNSLLNKDGDRFWKTYNQMNGKAQINSSMIDGYADDGDIANAFATKLKRVYSNSPANGKLKNDFQLRFQRYFSDHCNDNLRPWLFSSSELLDAIFSLKTGKATGTFLKAEHLFHSSPELLCHLHLVFNALLSHSYLPNEFLYGTVSHIIKDSNGDSTDSSNYRGITLGPILSHVFEAALLRKFGSFLASDNLQFGFKKSHSTSHAIFVLRSTIDYYLSHGSSVIVAFLDCSKAFDTISHYGIFLKMMDRNVPLVFLAIMIYWYCNMKCRCRWNNSFSEFFDVLTGTKQGGVLSPQIFTLYMDDLIIRLRKKGIGCHILNLFIACLFYADDLCLVAPTRSAMQQMLYICEEFCNEFCLSFNVKKSKALLFGKWPDATSSLLLNDEPIEYVQEWKYLGCTVISGKKLTFSAKPHLRSFYCAINSLLGAVRQPNDLVLMKLLYSNCVPILTYAAEVRILSNKDMQTYNVALNDSIRRIFSYNRWESTRFLRQELGYQNITEISQSRTSNFLTECIRSHNPVIKAMADLTTL